MAIPPQSLVMLWTASRRLQEQPTPENRELFEAALDIVLRYEQLAAAEALPPRRSFRFAGLAVATVSMVLVVTFGVLLLILRSKAPDTAAATVAPSQIYANDFETGDLSGWFGYGNHGIIVLADGNQVLGFEPGNSVILLPAETWTDYTVRLDYFVPDWATFGDGGFNIGVRQTRDVCRGYGLWLTATSGIVTRNDSATNNCQDGTFEDIRRVDFDNPAGVWHTAVVEVVGGRLRFKIDDSAQYQATDARYLHGALTLSSSGRMYIDNISVTAPQ